MKRTTHSGYECRASGRRSLGHLSLDVVSRIAGDVGVASCPMDEFPSLGMWPSAQEFGVILWESWSPVFWLRFLSKRGLPEQSLGYGRLKTSKSGEDWAWQAPYVGSWSRP